MDIRSMQSFIQQQAMKTMTSSVPNQKSGPSSIFNLLFKQMVERQMTDRIPANQTRPDDRSPVRSDATNSQHALQKIPDRQTAGKINHPDITEKTEKAETYDPYIQNAAEKYDVNPDLIQSVIKAESGFNTHASSGAGAQGLMQLMPKTAGALGVTDPNDPQQNIDGGTKYLSQMLDKYHGDTKLALAAYNAGPGNVDKHQGLPPFQETQQYVDKVMTDYLA